MVTGQTFTWSHPTTTSKESSTSHHHYLCDQKWHSVTVTKKADALSITVDQITMQGGGIVDEANKGQVKGMMFVGGKKGINNIEARKARCQTYCQKHL